MKDAFDVLAEDHEEIRQVLAELEKGPTAATGATEDQLMLRTIMTEELIAEEAKHEEAELACLWPAVREYVPGGEPLADMGVCAELEITALLAGLGKLDAGQPGFEDALAAFTRAAREHFDFEERHVWPRLRSALTPRAAAQLGGKILLARQSPPALAAPAPGESAHHGSFG